MTPSPVIWQWQTWNDLPYLTCSLLADWSHGFFTRQFSPQTPEQLVNVLQPGAAVYRLKQIHSNQILRFNLMWMSLLLRPSTLKIPQSCHFLREMEFTATVLTNLYGLAPLTVRQY
jgi:hypothetical protein